MLKLLSNTAMDAVDGAGALRIMSEFDSSEMQTNAGKVSVRLGADDDAVVVWPWRNSDSTRRYSFDPSPVRLDQHVEWWNRTLADSQCSLLIGLLEGIAFGVLRFDFDTSETAVISIYLDPAKTGKGMGQALLREGLSWLKENHLKTKIVSAEILPENPASLRVFQSAGFVEQHRSLIYRV